MILPTEWSALGTAFYVVFGAFAVLLGFLDYYEWFPMRYSKFAGDKGIPSRVGMFVLYSLPIVTSVGFGLPYLANANAVQWVVFAAITLHFVKRTLEVLFVHKYSGYMQTFTFVIIVVTYALIGGMISGLNVKAIPAMDALFYLGIVLFIIGEVGNYYHHKLLADLRSGTTGYFIPRGGWFKYATCPHYFFELLAWLGIVLMSRHLFTVLAFIAMFGYLTGRSIKTRAWYRERFKDYPADRKFMIPYPF